MKLEKETALYNRDAIKDDIQELESKIGETPNYFWFEGSASAGDLKGAHVTQIPEADFRTNPSGGNVKIDDTSVKICDGLIANAEFTPTAFRVGDYLHNFRNAQFVLDNYNGDGSIKCEYWNTSTQRFQEGDSFIWWNGDKGQFLELSSMTESNTADLTVGDHDSDNGDYTTKGISLESYSSAGLAYNGCGMHLFPDGLKVKKLERTHSRTEVASIDRSGYIYSNQHNKPIGDTEFNKTVTPSDSGTPTAALAAGTWKTIGLTNGYTFTPGVYIGFIDVQFSAATGSYRSLYFGTSNTGTSIGLQVGGSTTSAIIVARMPYTLSLDSSSTYYIRARSGVACEWVDAHVRAIRIR